MLLVWLFLALASSVTTLVAAQAPCGQPVEEGQAMSITCNFKPGPWCHDDDVTWWVKPTGGPKSFCILGPYCKKAISRHVGFISSTLVEVGSGTSNLRIPEVSRMSEAYRESSRWYCQICSRMVPVCDKLEIYVKPKDVVCKTKRFTDNDNVVKLVEIQCNTPHVYPQAKCDFTQILEHGEMHITTTPNYTHSHMMDVQAKGPDFYSSQCSLMVPVTQPAEDMVFQIAIYPDVTGGPKYGVLVKLEDPAPERREKSTRPSKDSNFDNKTTEKEMRMYKTAFIVVFIISFIIITALTVVIVLLVKGRISTSKKSSQKRFQSSSPPDEVALSANDGQAEVSGVYEQYQYVDPSGYLDLNSQGAKAFPVPVKGYENAGVTCEEPKYDLPQLQNRESANFYHQL